QLDDVSGARSQHRGQVRVEVDRHSQTRFRFQLVGQGCHHLAELTVGQQAGSQAEDVVAEVSDGRIDLSDGALQTGLKLGRGRDRHRLQVHANGEERLDDAVVE